MGVPIEEVGALGEYEGDVGVGVPTGAVDFVGEVPAQEDVCATVGVTCEDKNVVERIVRVCDPHSKEGVQLKEGGLSSLMDGVPNGT